MQRMIRTLQGNLVIILTPPPLSAQEEYKEHHGLLRTAALVEEYAKLSLKAAEGFSHAYTIDVFGYFNKYSLEHLSNKYFKDRKSSFNYQYVGLLTIDRRASQQTWPGKAGFFDTNVYAGAGAHIAPSTHGEQTLGCNRMIALWWGPRRPSNHRIIGSSDF